MLMNWKERKPSCFAISNWLEDYLDLLKMERAAVCLKDFIVVVLVWFDGLHTLTYKQDSLP